MLQLFIVINYIRKPIFDYRNLATGSLCILNVLIFRTLKTVLIAVLNCFLFDKFCCPIELSTLTAVPMWRKILTRTALDQKLGVKCK